MCGSLIRCFRNLTSHSWLDRVEESSDIRVENVVHLLAGDPDYQRIQRIVLATLGSEPIREPDEVLFVDRVQHCDCRPLDDLVFKGGDRKRALPAIWLRYISPPGWQCPVRSPLDPRVQVLDPAIEVCLVVLPCQPIYARGSFSLEREERRPEHFRADMVEERGEPFLLPFLAAFRMRSSACDTLSRSCARRVLCWPAFPLVSALGSIGSAVGCPTLFVDFTATMAESDFSRSCIIGYGSSPSRCGPVTACRPGQP